MRPAGFSFYKRVNISLGFWWILSIVASFFVFRYTQQKLPLISLIAKIYLIASLALIGFFVLLIFAATILLLLAFWKIRKAGRKAGRKKPANNDRIIDAEYKIK